MIERHDVHVTAWAKHHARLFACKQIAAGFKPVALHKYDAADGLPLYWKIRLKHANGSKWIRPMMRRGSGFAMGEPQFPNGKKPLYRLHELAVRQDAIIFVTEGESCADALAAVGILATTSGGADSADAADWTPLAGRTITIWPDNDEAGQRYAATVVAKLKPLGCTVRMIDVAALNLTPKHDVVDWLAAHPTATKADLAGLPTVESIEHTSEPPAGEFAPATCQDAAGMPPSSEQAAPASQTLPTNDAATIARLAALSPLEYDRCRKDVAKTLGVRPAILDKLVQAERRGGDDDGMTFPDVEPWPDAVNASELLSDIAATVRRFIVCSPEVSNGVALWVAMTWLMDVVNIAPLAVITAPDKRCGKSQLLFLLARLAHRPLAASNISPAALFRAVDAWRPTLLVDEADAFMRDNEELRGILNAGHTRDSAYVVRIVGEDLKPARFNVWGAKALAGIGHLADTLMDRAIVLELHRKLPHETVERLRYAEPELFDGLAAKLACFAEDNRDAVCRARPELPASLNDRAQDNWEPLLAIADVAGGTWPELGRRAALKLSGADSPTMTVGTELLSDIQEVFDTKGVQRITSADLIEALCADDEAPWATYNRGQPINPRQISKRLGEYGIKPKNIRLGYSKQAKGYDIEQFEDAFSRYLSAPPAASVPPSLHNNGASFPGTGPQSATVTEKPAVPLEAAPVLAWDGGTDKNGGMEL